MNVHPLYGPHIRLVRAEEHLDKIDELFAGFRAANPYKVVGKLFQNSQFYEYSLFGEPPPLDFAVLGGEAIYNLRSALDQLVWQLCLLTTQKPENRAEFLIYRSPKEFRANRWKLKALPLGASDVVEGLQPYVRSPRPEDDLLWKLHTLCIADKHRAFNRIVPTVSFPKLAGIEIPKGPIDDGDVFARVPISVDVKKDFEPYVAVTPTLKVEGPAGGQGISVFREVHEYVRSVVLPLFIGFFPPIPESIDW